MADDMVRILAVNYADRVELYSTGNVTVQQVQALDMPTAEGELLAESYLEHTLPWGYREVFEPHNKIATCLPRSVRPSQHLHTLCGLAVVRGEWLCPT